MDKCANTYLVLRFSSLGNVAMLVPVLYVAAQSNPEARFVVVARKRLGDMFYGIKNVTFLSVENSDSGKTESVWKVFRRLENEFDISGVLDLQRNVKSRLLSVLFGSLGVKVWTIGRNRSAEHRLLRKGYSECAPLRSEFDRYAEVFSSAGLRLNGDFYSLPVNAEAAQNMRLRYGAKLGSWIGVAPFAKSKTNMLPYRISKEVIAHFAAKSDARIFLFGAGRVECDMLRQWAELYDNVESVAGVLELSEELELMRSLDFMLCMDSANRHLASLVGLKCVTVWCGTHPYAGFGGWNKENERVMQQPLSCRPCTIHGRNKCKYRNFLCRQFTSAEIINECLKLNCDTQYQAQSH